MTENRKYQFYFLQNLHTKIRPGKVHPPTSNTVGSPFRSCMKLERVVGLNSSENIGLRD